MRLMTDHHFRHLPVLDGDKIAGIVSIGDLVNWIISAQHTDHQPVADLHYRRARLSCHRRSLNRRHPRPLMRITSPSPRCRSGRC